MADQFTTSENESGTGGGINWTKIGYQALRYWYLILFCFIGALLIAFYNNRYAQKIYPVVASIIIREKEETNGAELLYKNALIDQYRNYLNEPYILRSYPLVQRVVEELGFDISVLQEGYVRTSEIYKGLPFKVRRVPGNFQTQKSVKLLLTIKDEDTYMFQSASQKETPLVARFGDPLLSSTYGIQIDKTEADLKEYVGQKFIVVVRDPQQVAGEYIGKLDINWAEEGSGVLNIRVTGPTPEKDIRFIGGLIERYVEADLTKKNLTANKTVDFIQDQLLHITDSLRVFERQLQRFKQENRTSGSMELESQHLMTRIESIQQQRAGLMMRAKYYEYLVSYMDKGTNLDQVVLPTTFGVNDAVISNIVNKIVDAQLELKLYLGKEKTMSPLVSNRMSRLGELKRELLEAVGGLRATDQITMNFLDSQLTQINKSVEYLPSAERQLVSIKRNYSLLENLYVFLMQKMSEAQISKASNASDIVVVNPPRLGGGPIFPKVSQNYSLAAVLGLGIPFAILVLIELTNTKIQSKEDIDRLTSIPFIGGIGHKKTATNNEVLNYPKSSITESFRAIRSNLLYFIDVKSRPVILISSSISGEGKSFTSVNLASIFALSGKKTLIVGADMRKPKIYQDFGLSNHKGLSTFLSGMDEFEQVIQKTPNEFLDLASGGPVPPNPSELLLSPRLVEFFQKARTLYDYVIIDTPPMAIVTDAFILAPLADHTLFIVRQNYSPKSLVQMTNDFYTTGKIKNMSVVLNDIYKSGFGYGYGYGYSYDYYTYGYGKRKNGYGYYSEE